MNMHDIYTLIMCVSFQVKLCARGYSMDVKESINLPGIALEMIVYACRDSHKQCSPRMCM